MILSLLGENGIELRISYVKHSGTLTTRIADRYRQSRLKPYVVGYWKN
jgi:hypothetical protein